MQQTVDALRSRLASLEGLLASALPAQREAAGQAQEYSQAEAGYDPGVERAYQADDRAGYSHSREAGDVRSLSMSEPHGGSRLGSADGKQAEEELEGESVAIGGWRMPARPRSCCA